MLTLLYVLHFIVCFILIAVVLLQRGKGQDLGASLGGGGANTIFGSRGAGNFLTRMTTASAIIFMGTSLSLSYLGYKSSDVRLFEESEPFVPEGAAPSPAESTLEELPAATEASAGDAGASAEGAGSAGLVEIPAGADGAAATESAPADAASAPPSPATSTPAAGAPPEPDPAAATRDESAATDQP